MPFPIDFIIHTRVVHTKLVCPNLTPCHISKVNVILTAKQFLCPVHIFEATKRIDFILRTRVVHTNAVYPDIDPMSYLKGQCHYGCCYFCPVHIFEASTRDDFILHTRVVHTNAACHDLDPRSYLKGQGQRSRHILFTICKRWLINFVSLQTDFQIFFIENDMWILFEFEPLLFCSDYMLF